MGVLGDELDISVGVAVPVDEDVFVGASDMIVNGFVGTSD